MLTYTNIGSVRGLCRHQHRTLTGACRCLLSDQQGCRVQGGHSDRTIRRSDGDVLPTAEAIEVDDIMDRMSNPAMCR